MPNIITSNRRDHHYRRFALVTNRMRPRPLQVLNIRNIPRPLRMKRSTQHRPITLANLSMSEIRGNRIVANSHSRFRPTLLNLTRVTAPRLIRTNRRLILNTPHRQRLMRVTQLSVTRTNSTTNVLVPANLLRNFLRNGSNNRFIINKSITRSNSLIINSNNLRHFNTPPTNNRNQARFRHRNALNLNIIRRQLRPHHRVNSDTIPQRRQALQSMNRRTFSLQRLPMRRRNHSRRIAIIRPTRQLTIPLNLSTHPHQNLRRKRQKLLLSRNRVNIHKSKTRNSNRKDQI